jgi:hypothetical protein
VRPIDAFLLVTGSSGPSLRCFDTWQPEAAQTRHSICRRRSAHPAAKKALAEIYNAENKAAAVKAAHNFATEYGAKWPKAVAKIVDDLDVLTAFYDYPAEHWIHLRTTNPIESTFATVRLRQRVTKGPGSRAAGVAMASNSSNPPSTAGEP